MRAKKFDGLLNFKQNTACLEISFALPPPIKIFRCQQSLVVYNNNLIYPKAHITHRVKLNSSISAVSAD
ncbi:hypothetical protein BZL35_00505 [Candidatus Pandoraea novymonadis]|uniref:Uncharacterized protein n=1 Tax=Candidatus Pandoraea novymonadis TaxID=1808959 RepID=A0ABX5FF00_9BURK|nr:hypothetical protein BZL35_00505 [Candidatus Pandoraea novymonadis]